LVASDCPEIINRISCVDFCKASDLIDHNILSDKFVSASGGVPEHVDVRSLDFLSGRSRFVKTGESRLQIDDEIDDLVQLLLEVELRKTQYGRNDFKLIINSA